MARDTYAIKEEIDIEYQRMAEKFEGHPDIARYHIPRIVRLTEEMQAAQAAGDTVAVSSALEIKQPPPAPAPAPRREIRYTLPSTFAPHCATIAAAMQRAQRLGISEARMLGVLAALDGKLTRAEARQFADDDQRTAFVAAGWEAFVHKHGAEEATKRRDDGRTFWDQVGLAEMVKDLHLDSDYDVIEDGFSAWDARERK